MPRAVAIGVDVGASYIKGVVFASSGERLAAARRQTDRQGGPEAVVAQVRQMAQGLLEQAQLHPAQVAGLGVGVPGLVDPQTDLVDRVTNLPSWERPVPLRAWLGRELDCGWAIEVDNDANATALSEQHYGAGRGYEQLVCLVIGTGIGAGIILDGQLVRGWQGGAGEVGYIVLGVDGQGRYLAFEDCVSKGAIERAVVERLPGRPESLLAQEAALSVERVFAAAERGDVLAREIFTEAGRYLGMGLVSIANTLAPQVIVVGGGIAQAGDYLFQPMRQTIAAIRASFLLVNNFAVVPAQLGEWAGAVGAATLVLAQRGEVGAAERRPAEKLS